MFSVNPAISPGGRAVEARVRLQKEGRKVRLAAANGVSDRLRPIITTTVTTILGLIPLALSDPTWLPLCSAIIFGLLTGSLGASLIVPAVYLLLTPKTEQPTEAIDASIEGKRIGVG